MAIPTSPELFIVLNRALAAVEAETLNSMMSHFKIEKLARRGTEANILLGGEKTTYEAVGNKMKRIYKLGGQVKGPFKVAKVGNNIREFMALGYASAEDRLKLFREAITLADSIGDIETAEMCRDLYRKTEKHLHFMEEYRTIEIEEPEGPDDIEVEHTKAYDAAYFALLNRAVAAEISAIFTYTTQRARLMIPSFREKVTNLEVVQGTNKAEVIAQQLRAICLEEMHHLEWIAERIYKIGGDCTDLVPIVEVGETLDDYIRFGKRHEDEAIVLYREIVATAGARGDVVTKRLFERILEEEDGHYYQFDDWM